MDLKLPSVEERRNLLRFFLQQVPFESESFDGFIGNAAVLMAGWSPADVKQSVTEACMTAARECLEREEPTASLDLASVKVNERHFRFSLHN